MNGRILLALFAFAVSAMAFVGCGPDVDIGNLRLGRCGAGDERESEAGSGKGAEHLAARKGLHAASLPQTATVTSPQSQPIHALYTLTSKPVR